MNTFGVSSLPYSPNEPLWLRSEVNKEPSLWQFRANRAPGTTHACKRFVPEKVYLAVGFESDFAAFCICNLFQRELSNLLGQQRSRFVNCDWIRQQFAQTGQALQPKCQEGQRVDCTILAAQSSSHLA